ncbi:MAG: glycerol-3-phosphate 1-O-acyltransferase PlsY [Nitrospirota bacterium]
MIIILALIAFLIGSIPTGVVIARSKGIDLRGVGSGNIGATNVMRAAGKEAALLTLIGDMAKGAIPLLLYRGLLAWGMPPLEPELLQGTGYAPRTVIEGVLGISAIAGHDFSLFLKGRGGKGVATSLGVLLVFSPHVGLFTITLWLITAKWTRYSSLSALVAFGLLPVSFFLIDYAPERLLVAFAIALLIFIKHRDNIRRLLQGTEGKIGEKK